MNVKCDHRHIHCSYSCVFRSRNLDQHYTHTHTSREAPSGNRAFWTGDTHTHSFSVLACPEPACHSYLNTGPKVGAVPGLGPRLQGEGSWSHCVKQPVAYQGDQEEEGVFLASLYFWSLGELWRPPAKWCQSKGRPCTLASLQPSLCLPGLTPVPQSLRALLLTARSHWLKVSLRSPPRSPRKNDPPAYWFFIVNTFSRVLNWF